MKFTFEDKPENQEYPVRVGNVYDQIRERATNGYVYIVVSVSNHTLVALTLSGENLIVNGARYDINYFKEHKPIGHCPDLQNLTFKIERI